jgi:hypothetical protein
MHPILAKLTGGDRCSIGRSEEVAAEVLANPALFDPLFGGLLADDPLIRMRAADAVEKITAQRPEYLQPYKSILIERVAPIDQQEVRWHVAQILPRLHATPAERAAVVGILQHYLRDRSKIVCTFAMQALADLAAADTALRAQVIPLLKQCAAAGSPAMRSRGRKLLKQLKAG